LVYKKVIRFFLDRIPPSGIKSNCKPLKFLDGVKMKECCIEEKSGKANISKKIQGSDAISSAANHAEELPRLRRIQGQVQGIERMIQDGRYCPDILIQIKAIHAALKRVETDILKRHLNHCVKIAFNSKNSKASEKVINEISNIFEGTFR
jgi:DNA-binding FrmR family transcriptional regulator